MKGVTLEPGPKPHAVVVPLPDCVLQYLGWKEGDYVELEIRAAAGGTECLLLTRRVPPAREGY